MSRRVLLLLDEAGNPDELTLLRRAFPHVAFIFLFAALFGTFVSPAIIAPLHKDVALAVLGGLLAFGGLVIGFVANLMLFTGKVESAPLLSLEEVLAYSSRIRQLLHSQALTLTSGSILAAFCIITMAALALEPPQVTEAGFVALTFAYGAHCAARAFLLPLQVFELHHAWLNDLAEMKARELRSRYSGQQ